MKRVAVLVSGGGTNLQALLESERRGENPNGKIELVVASKPGVYALERAANFGVESAVVSRRDYADSAAFDAALLDTLQKHSIDVVVLAGFLSVLGEKVIAAYRNKIINVHPSLIPSFCGPGFYGLRVHEAALARGVKLTGATVHLVNEECDGGPILLQKAVAVEPGDTPETLQKRVMGEAGWQGGAPGAHDPRRWRWCAVTRCKIVFHHCTAGNPVSCLCKTRFNNEKESVQISCRE